MPDIERTVPPHESKRAVRLGGDFSVDGGCEQS